MALALLGVLRYVFRLNAVGLDITFLSGNGPKITEPRFEEEKYSIWVRRTTG